LYFCNDHQGERDRITAKNAAHLPNSPGIVMTQLTAGCETMMLLGTRFPSTPDSQFGKTAAYSAKKQRKFEARSITNNRECLGQGNESPTGETDVKSLSEISLRLMHRQQLILSAVAAATRQDAGFLGNCMKQM
jgi:hypothetical protein